MGVAGAFSATSSAGENTIGWAGVASPGVAIRIDRMPVADCPFASVTV